VEIDAHGTGRIGDEITGIAVAVVDGDLPVVLTSGQAPGVHVSALYDGSAVFSLDGIVANIAVVDADGHPFAIAVDEYRARAWDLDQAWQIRSRVTLTANAKPYGDAVVCTYPGLREYGAAVAAGRLGSRPVAVTASYDRAVHVWDVRDGQTVAVLAGHSATVRTVAASFGASGGAVVTGDDDGVLRIFDLEPIAGHSMEVRSLAWGQVDGQILLFSAGVDGRVWIWDPGSGEPVGTFAGPERIYALALGVAESEPFAAMGGPRAQLRIGRLPSGAARWELEPRPPGTAAEDSFWELALTVRFARASGLSLPVGHRRRCHGGDQVRISTAALLLGCPGAGVPRHVDEGGSHSPAGARGLFTVAPSGGHRTLRRSAS
jgi:hypothetical protein